MLYKWRPTRLSKLHKQYIDMCRTYPVFRHSRTHDFFKICKFARVNKLHKLDVLRKRTGRGYCASIISDVTTINKHNHLLIW